MRGRTEKCHNTELNIATKLRMKGKKNVATHDNSIATFKTLSRQMKRELDEYTLKQCCDIKIDCRDIQNCRRKKFCHDTRELSHDKSWQIIKASHDSVCHNKDFDVATNILENETFKA